MYDLRTREQGSPGYVDYPEDDYADYGYDADYDDYDEYAAPVDQRWRPIAVVAGGVFLAAAVTTAVILNSDSGGAQETVVGPPPTRTVVATPTAPAPSASRSPETVTTLTPAVPPSQSSVEPAPPAAPEAAVPAPPMVNPRTVVYRVTGTKQLLDLVSVVYTDEQGVPHTELNVALPWTKTVVLNPGVNIESVTATSLFGQLNCSIVDAAGQPLAVSANNSMVTTCTR